MMEIRLIAVGKLKEPYLRAAEEHLEKMVGKKVPIKIVEVADEKTKEQASEKEMDKVKDLEGQRILKQVDRKGQMYVMDLSGKKIKSMAFQGIVREAMMEDIPLQLVIGGSLGLSKDVLKAAKGRISFGEMTYPHQLFRIMLLEELYKCL